MKSRYCYCPMTAPKIGRRMTLADRFRSWQRDRKRKTTGYPFGDYYSPVHPGK